MATKEDKKAEAKPKADKPVGGGEKKEKRQKGGAAAMPAAGLPVAPEGYKPKASAGEPGHGLVWDEQLHVPLLMRVPGQAPRRVATQLSVVDVVPTLLGLVPLPGSERFLEQSSGFDVLHDDHVERAVFGMSSERQLEFGRWAYALTTPRWKLVVEEDGVERYRVRTRADNRAGWLAYLVAVR